MLKSMEQMAMDKLMVYIRPMIRDGIVLFAGHGPDVAARKAAAASPNFAKEIYLAAEKIKREGSK